MAYHHNGLSKIENAIEKQVSKLALKMHKKDPNLSIHDVLRPIAYAYICMETSTKILTAKPIPSAAKSTYENLIADIKGSPALSVINADCPKTPPSPKEFSGNGRRRHNPLQDLHILYYANSKGGLPFNEDGLISHLKQHDIDYHTPTLRNTLSRFCKDKRFLKKDESVPKTYTIEEAGRTELKALTVRYDFSPQTAPYS